MKMTLRFRLPLLLPLLHGIIAVSGSPLQTAFSLDCGPDCISVLESTEGFCFLVNQNAVSRDFFCEALDLNVAEGCRFVGSSDTMEWNKIRDRYCLSTFSDTSGVNSNVKGRKILHESRNYSSHVLTEKTQAKEGNENKQRGLSLPSQKFAVAAPVLFFLCCLFVCPCFGPKRKELVDQNFSSKEYTFTRDPVSSFDVSASSERLPGTPHRPPPSPLRVPPSPYRVPPSPSRFSSPQLSRVGSDHLTLSQILKATQNFSASYVIGEGGFGTVYKAPLPNGLVVAVKRAKKENIAALQSEYLNEIELLSKIEHRSLVKLIGYIEKGNERLIITEYVPNGTLREHLDGARGTILDFNQRLEISIDVAHALTYLHLYAEKKIIHRDVKSSNILLTETLRAKVADFGFAKTGPMDEEKTHIYTKVKGTAGYLDPEYLQTYQLTPKSDVFSFGILLLEIFTGRRPVDMKKTNQERITVRWAFTKFSEGHIMELLDPELEEEVDEDTLSRIFGLAFECAAPTRADRPTMKEVGEQLWGIRKGMLQQTSQKGV